MDSGLQLGPQTVQFRNRSCFARLGKPEHGEVNILRNSLADWRRHLFVAGFARIRTIRRESGQRPNSCESGYHLAEVLPQVVSSIYDTERSCIQLGFR